MKNISNPYIATAKRLQSGEKITIQRLAVKTQKHLSFSCKLDDIGNGHIYIGHGKEISGSSWLEIDKDEVKAYAYYSYANPQYRSLLKEPLLHGLNIRDSLKVNVDVNPDKIGAYLTLSTPSGTVSAEMFGWDGVDGEIFASAEACELFNCNLSWYSDGFMRRIWVLGDSYAGITGTLRWPAYLIRDGYTSNMICGFPGMPAERSIEEFKKMINNGKPEFVFWTLGMNNEDKNGEINPLYKKATEELIAICLERGITPILATIPNVPERDHTKKNAWIRSLPYRYVDFECAVGSDKRVDWYEGMLYADKVHPDEKGAKALYEQVLRDFPEIMQKD